VAARRRRHWPHAWPQRTGSIGDSRMSVRLRFRLSAPAMAVSCLPLLVGAVVAWDFQRSQRGASEALALNVRSVRASEELASGVRDLRAQLARYLLTGDGAHLNEVPRLHEEMDRWLGEARVTAVTPREEELVGRLEGHYERLFDGAARLERVAPEGRPAAVR